MRVQVKDFVTKDPEKRLGKKSFAVVEAPGQRGGKTKKRVSKRWPGVESGSWVGRKAIKTAGFSSGLWWLSESATGLTRFRGKIYAISRLLDPFTATYHLVGSY
jgi:hypothetical protein